MPKQRSGPQGSGTAPRHSDTDTVSWPVLPVEALHGLAGDVVRTMSPHTEADEAAVLADFLTTFGAACGPEPHAHADGSDHPGREFVLIVGETSRARKGTARARVASLFEGIHEAASVVGGLASGEGLIRALDETDGGLRHDKRLLVYEPEFVRVLTVMKREGSTLSAILRDAWDTGDLSVLTKSDPLVVAGASVSIVAHCTAAELTRRLDTTEVANGLVNRFLIVAARRSKLLPSGGVIPTGDFSRLLSFVRQAVGRARRIDRMERTPAAEARWDELYRLMAEDDGGGLVGALSARSEAHVLRLSVIYALIDGSPAIDIHHVDAAWALWTYCRQSAHYFLGDTLGDEVADTLLAELKTAGDEGLTGKQIQDLFSRHVTARRIERARRELEARGLVFVRKVRTSGRPRLVTVYREANKAKKAIKGSTPASKANKEGGKG